MTAFSSYLAKARHWRLLLICLGGILVTGPAGHAQKSVIVDRIVAVVNSDIITLFDLERALQPYAKNIKALRYPAEKERQMLFQVRKDILDRLIDAKLADQEIKRNQISVSEGEIDGTIERLKEARSLTDEQLREGLSRQGITMEEYRKEIKEQLLRSKLINREVKSKIVITKEDIKAYYDSHREKYAGEKKYHLWNIFVKLPSGATAVEKKAAHNQMQSIYDRLAKGTSFETMVQEVTEAGGAVHGTDLGLFRPHELSQRLQTAVKKMKTGDFSRVLETDFGYQIIYVQDIQETPARSIEEVKPEIHQLLYNEFVNNKYQKWLEALRRQALIKIVQ